MTSANMLNTLNLVSLEGPQCQSTLQRGKWFSSYSVLQPTCYPYFCLFNSRKLGIVSEGNCVTLSNDVSCDLWNLMLCQSEYLVQYTSIIVHMSFNSLRLSDAYMSAN